MLREHLEGYMIYCAVNPTASPDGELYGPSHLIQGSTSVPPGNLENPGMTVPAGSGGLCI